MKSNSSGNQKVKSGSIAGAPGQNLSQGGSISSPINTNRSHGHSLQHANYGKLTGAPSTALGPSGSSKSPKAVGS